MENWISNMYNAAIAKHKDYNLQDGMAIFYSPVVYNPKVLFIGDNPGSCAGTIHKRPPEKSEYSQDSYELAKLMRRIFGTPALTKIIENSVITNRVFFQSENTKKFKDLSIWQDMEDWCFPHVKTIINKINPEIIFAQSIGCYESLIREFNGKYEDILVPDGKKGLLRSGKIGDKLVLAIKHPTNPYNRVSFENWRLVTEKLSEILND